MALQEVCDRDVAIQHLQCELRNNICKAQWYRSLLCPLALFKQASNGGGCVAHNDQSKSSQRIGRGVVKPTRVPNMLKRNSKGVRKGLDLKHICARSSRILGPKRTLVEKRR